MPNFYQWGGIALMLPLFLVFLLLGIHVLGQYIKKAWFKIKALPQIIKTMDKVTLFMHILFFLFVIGFLLWAWGRAVEMTANV